MPDYAWNLKADAKTAQTSAIRINILNQTINNLNDVTRKNTNVNVKWKSSWLSMLGAWNTINKAFDFGIKRINQLKDGMTFLIRKVQEIGGAFQESRAGFQAYAETAGATKEQIKAVIEQSKLLGRTTRFTAKNAVDAAITMVKAGSDITDILRDQEAALKGAQAAGISISKAASIAAHGQKFFADEIHNAEQALKMQIAAAQAAEVTITQLDASMKKGGGAAARAEMRISRFNAAMALFAEKGNIGGKAGNDLTRILTALTARTPAAEKAIKKLGVSVTELVDGKEQMRDVGQVFEDIKNSLSQFDFTTQSRILKDLFGRGLINSAQIFLDAGIEGFDEMEKKILDAQEAMQRFAELKSDTIANSLAAFRSALEGVYVELVDILDLPIQTYWKTLADILNTVTDRIKAVSLQFVGSKKTLDDWINIIKKQGFKGIFKGLGKELEDEINTLKKLFTAGWEAIKALSKEFFKTTFPEGLEPAINKAGEILGEIFAKAFWNAFKIALKNPPNLTDVAVALADAASNFVRGTIKGGEKGLQKSAEQETQQKALNITEKRIQTLIEQRKELSKIPLIERTDEDATKIKFLTKQLQYFRKVKKNILKDIGEKPSVGIRTSVQAEEFASSLDELNRKAQEEVTKKQQQRQSLPQIPLKEQKKRAALDAIQRIEEATGKKVTTRGDADAEIDRLWGISQTIKAAKKLNAERSDPANLEMQQNEIDAQINLTNKTTQWKETLEQSKNIIQETKISLIETGKEFAKWMLEPVDIFKKRLNDIKGRFADMRQDIKGKLLDLSEKFGVKTGVSRQGILQEAIKSTEEQLRAAQTPEEKAQLEQKRAQQLTQLAETGDKGAANQAKLALENALKAQKEDERIKKEQVKIDKEAAKKAIPQLQQMLAQTETAGGRASILERLQQNFQNLGDVQHAGEATRQLMEEQMKAGIEQAEQAKQMAESLKISVDILKQIAKNTGEFLDVPPVDTVMLPNPA